MSPPSSITALAEQHRRDLSNQAETYRLARAARNNRPAPTRHMPSLRKIARLALALTASPALQMSGSGHATCHDRVGGRRSGRGSRQPGPV
jgi:hypothetical protein